MRKILREYADVFAKDDLSLGWTSIVKYKNTLKEGQTNQKWYRRVAPGLSNEVQKYLQEMIDVGVI